MGLKTKYLSGIRQECRPTEMSHLLHTMNFI